MAEIAKSDVFFLITSMAVVILTVIVAVLLVYIFFIVRSVKSVVEKVREESDLLLEDIKELRHKLKAEESTARRAGTFLAFLRGMFFGKRKRN